MARIGEFGFNKEMTTDLRNIIDAANTMEKIAVWAERIGDKNGDFKFSTAYHNLWDCVEEMREVIEYYESITRN